MLASTRRVAVIRQKVRFAILRTSNFGKLRSDVPNQQFNHAIVYIPAQPGFAAPFFVDPTPDTLDLGNLPANDQGTTRLVLDPETGAWEMIPIPYDEPAKSYGRFKLQVEIKSPTEAKAEAVLLTKGPLASSLRHLLPNKSASDKFFQAMAGQLFQSAMLVKASPPDGEEIDRPIRIGLELDASRAIQERDGDYRLPLPAVLDQPGKTALDHRTMPLELGISSESDITVELTLPEGYVAKHLPADFDITAPCLEIHRRSSLKGRAITVFSEMRNSCHEVAVANYELYRDKVRDAIGRLRDEVTFGKAPPVVAGRKPRPNPNHCRARPGSRLGNRALDSDHGTSSNTRRARVKISRPTARPTSVVAAHPTPAITHPDKVLFPADGITKGELCAHYESVAPVMLPHIRGRPVTMERFPAGIDKKGFIQKDVSKGFPDWLQRVETPKRTGSDDDTVHYPLANDACSLVWLANQNSITPHVWTSRVPKLNQPDVCVFDLDPSTDRPAELRAAALAVRELLAELGLGSFVKTSGSKCFHILAALDGAADFESVRRFAHGAGAVLVKRHPALFTQEFIKADRDGRIFVDTGRNGAGATFAAVYAVRPKPGAPVSAPCTWQQVESGAVVPQTFTLRTIAARLAEVGDLWRDMYDRPHSLRDATAALERLLTDEDWNEANAASTRRPISRKRPRED